jgi:hypothetical protein
MINSAYVNYYNLSEHVAADEVTVLVKQRIIFKQYIESKSFDIKMFKLCDLTGYS